MIAVDVELLTGRYVATSYNDRSAPEWPPHPARLFSALVDVAADEEDESGVATEALRWLDGQEPPHVIASDAEARAVVTTYVPENTTRVLDRWERQEQQLAAAQADAVAAEHSGDPRGAQRARRAVDRARKRFEQRVAAVVADEGRDNRTAREMARKTLPDGRKRQPRTLPSVTPLLPRVRYIWPAATPETNVRDALALLVRRLVRLGHSSSLVSCRLIEADSAEKSLPDAHTWLPAEGGNLTLRAVAPGQFDRLRRAYARHQGVEPRVLPAVHMSYRRSDEALALPARSVFGEWLVLREVAVNGPRLGLQVTKTEDVTRALRGALLHHADDPPPDVLSGHTPDRRALEEPHVAFLCLADVAGPYCTGTILGMAVLLPREIDPDDRMTVLRAIGHWERQGLQLMLGRAGVMHLERVVDEDSRRTLQPQTWSAPSRHWASVTPVALDENPGNLMSRDPGEAAAAAQRAEQIVARSCERIGLPVPEWVQIMRRSLFRGAPAAHRFMPYPRHGRGLRRVCVHVELRFGEPVAGPVILGAGRYFGLGLCRGRGEE